MAPFHPGRTVALVNCSLKTQQSWYLTVRHAASPGTTLRNKRPPAAHHVTFVQSDILPATAACCLQQFAVLVVDSISVVHELTNNKGRWFTHKIRIGMFYIYIYIYMLHTDTTYIYRGYSGYILM